MEQTTEIQVTQPEEQKVPLGFTAKTESKPLITFQQFFDLIRAVDTLSGLTTFLKQENFNADNIRYYFKEDLVDVINEQGETTTQKKLREDFWN